MVERRWLHMVDHSMIKYVIVDIDGTVADIGHRLHHIQGNIKNYDKFYDECINDAPIKHIIDLVIDLQSVGYAIFFVSGRPDSHRKETQDWLMKNHLPIGNLYMRRAKDYRKDFIVKKEILDMIKEDHGLPKFVLDDRQQVVDMWRANGVPCLQVAPGDFDTPKIDKKPCKLVLLIGPSGAGKSSYVKNVFPYDQDAVISSDNIRGKVCGDFLDQSKNAQVFFIIHELIKTRISLGLDTIVDATNLRNADRRAIRDCANEMTKIEYHVINRPVEEKLKTGGWRLAVVNKGVGLIERHEQIFQSNLKDILNGDGDPRVTVLDVRQTK